MYERKNLLLQRNGDDARGRSKKWNLKRGISRRAGRELSVEMVSEITDRIFRKSKNGSHAPESGLSGCTDPEMCHPHAAQLPQICIQCPQ